jgi:hypothetical protein
MKIIYTNWINIVGVFTTLFLFTIISSMNDPNISRNIIQAIIASLIGIVLYGIIFWIGFVLSLIILDLILIVPNLKYLKFKLFLEWVLISIPFILWSIKYKEQQFIYLLGVGTFFITQLLRIKIINKLNPPLPYSMTKTK